ncbi:hypothetical protein N8192_00300 [bacterium]|nr:hypothetical protein [bacterium]
MNITFASVPYTSESWLLGTACATALATANYFPQSGVEAHQVAQSVFLTLENANLRYKMNGSAPATSCGHIWIAGDSLQFEDVAIARNLQLLNESGLATAYVHITYFGG